MTVHIFPTYAYCDQRQYMQTYLRKPPDMKIWTFTTRLIQLNMCLPHFLPDCPGQLVASLIDVDIKEILYHTIPNIWKKKMIEQGQNSLRQRLKIQKSDSCQNLPCETERRTRKGPRKGKLQFFHNFEDKDLDEGHKGKTFCLYYSMCGHTLDECSPLKSLIRQTKQVKSKHSRIKKGKPSMK